MNGTRGFRIDVAGMTAFVAAESAAKAKYLCIQGLRDGGWTLPSNTFSVIESCVRWPEGDGLEPKCHRLDA